MNYFSKFNKGSKFTVILDSDVKYMKLDDVEDGRLPFEGLYLSDKGYYGTSASLILNSKTVVNLPKHMVVTVKAIIEDDTAVKLINEGKVFFEKKDYIKDGKKHYTVEFYGESEGNLNDNVLSEISVELPF